MIITVTPNPVLDRTMTVPEIVFDEMTRATSVRVDWGGKGFNVSRVLLALGAESFVMGFVGGATGQRLATGLADLGLATDFVTIAGETRTNVVITDARAQHYIKVNVAGPAVTPEEIARFMDKVRERAAGGDTWVLSGSLPPGVPLDFYANLIRLLQQRDARVLLDASGEPLRLGCAARPFLVKPNAVEAAALTGIPSVSHDDALRAARAILRLGAAQVALSLGADGLLLATQDKAVLATPPTVPAKNVTGAGDALLAGLVLYNGKLLVGGDWALPHLRASLDMHNLRVVLGLLIVVQGFETSRFLGDEHPPELRIRTMRNAQLISGFIYLVFIGLATVLFRDDFGTDVTAIMTMTRPVAVVLPLLIGIAAVGSQFSAAIADDEGAGGLIEDISEHKLSVRYSYLLVLVVTTVLTWQTNVNQIIAYASRAFALFYALQGAVAFLVARQQQDLPRKGLRLATFAAVTLLCLLVFAFGVSSE